MTRIAPILAALCSLPAAFAGLVVVQDLNQTGPAPMKTELTIKVSGENVRIDMGKDLSTIVDSASGEVTSLMHSQKMAMAMPKGAMDAIKEKAGRQRDSIKPDLQPTGKKEEINGFACEEYAGTYDGLKIAYWVTQDVRNQDEILAELSKLSGDADPFKGALKDGSDFPGVPIRTVVESPQAGKSTMTILSIKQEDVPATEFEIPSGYRTMQVPNMPLPQGIAPGN